MGDITSIILYIVLRNMTSVCILNRMLKRLVSARVVTNAIESYSYCGAGRERWRNRGEGGRKQVVVEELQSRVLDSDFKVGKLKN